MFTNCILLEYVRGNTILTYYRQKYTQNNLFSIVKELHEPYNKIIYSKLQYDCLPTVTRICVFTKYTNVYIEVVVNKFSIY